MERRFEGAAIGSGAGEWPHPVYDVGSPYWEVRAVQGEVHTGVGTFEVAEAASVGGGVLVSEVGELEEKRVFAFSFIEVWSW